MVTPSCQATGRPCQRRGFFQIIGLPNRKKNRASVLVSSLLPKAKNGLKKRPTIDIQKDVESCMQRCVAFRERNDAGIRTLGQEQKSQLEVLVL